MGSIVDEHTRGLVAKTEETSQQLRTAIIASLRGLAELQPTAEKDFRTLDDSVKQQIEVIADKATILRSILDHTKATLELDEEVDLTLVSARVFCIPYDVFPSVFFPPVISFSFSYLCVVAFFLLFLQRYSLLSEFIKVP